MLLEPTAVSPALARAYCDEVLAHTGHDDRADDARLVVSELVTNAVVHAHSPIELSVVVRDDVLRIEVTDLGGEPPQVWARGDGNGKRDGGRGLPIVEEIGSDWGVVEQGAAKTVWCELAL